MFVSAHIDRRIPGGLIGLVGSTALVEAFGLQARGVAVLGTIQSGTPKIGLSGLSWSTLRDIIALREKVTNAEPLDLEAIAAVAGIRSELPLVLFGAPNASLVTLVDGHW